MIVMNEKVALEGVHNSCCCYLMTIELGLTVVCTVFSKYKRRIEDNPVYSHVSLTPITRHGSSKNVAHVPTLHRVTTNYYNQLLLTCMRFSADYQMSVLFERFPLIMYVRSTPSASGSFGAI